MATKNNLTELEMKRIEINIEKMQNIKLRKEMLSDKNKINELQIKVLELQKQIMVKDSTKYAQKSINLDKELTRLKESGKENIEKLKKKYKVKTKGFGYDPETGEIDREDR